jgi:hypothetical protein
MSGPIVRKYGFPNFEQIFGKRELEHGVEGKKPVDPLQRDSEKSQNPAETDKSGEAKAKP